MDDQEVSDEDLLDPKNHWRVGRVAGRPLRICANPNSQLLGEFAMSLLFINSLADHFDHRSVAVIYRSDADFKSELMGLLPTDFAMELSANQTLPSLEVLNGAAVFPKPHPLTTPWFQGGFHHADLFITDAMCASRMLQTLETLSPLRFPDADAETCSEALLEAGVRPDRWFCTLHCREPGYGPGPSGLDPLRDGDPRLYFATAKHIIRNLGGQVVRLGHPGMSQFPPTEGLIDLSPEGENAYLQAFAVSRSRFLLGSASGPAGLACALDVPHALPDAIDDATHNRRLVLRSVDIITPQGQRLSQQALFEAGLRGRAIYKPPGEGKYGVMKNSPEEIRRLANFAYELTRDTAGWREPEPPRAGPRPNQIAWPAIADRRAIFLPAGGES